MKKSTVRVSEKAIVLLGCLEIDKVAKKILHSNLE